MTTIKKGESMKKEYNSSIKQNKTFEGNVFLFASNGTQYGKRFQKGACCKSNMILWGNGKNDNVFICAQCGFIEKEKSNIMPIVQEKKSFLSDSEKSLFLDSEPDIKEIKEIDSIFTD